MRLAVFETLVLIFKLVFYLNSMHHQKQKIPGSTILIKKDSGAAWGYSRSLLHPKNTPLRRKERCRGSAVASTEVRAVRKQTNFGF